MKEELLDLLACPMCRGPLLLAARGIKPGSGGIDAGTLECVACPAEFPVRDGIPRFTTPDRHAPPTEVRTVAQYVQRFTAIAEDDSDLLQPELVEHCFYYRTGLDPKMYEHPELNPILDWFSEEAPSIHRPSAPGADLIRSITTAANTYRPDTSFLSGKRVLDAGCGAGRFTTVAAGGAAEVIGLDLGDHVDRAARRCASFSNVQFVQGSVLNPPFRAGSFDYVYSIGVLHHTTDPQRGCRELARLLTAEGAISVWVYPPEYWDSRLRGAVERLINLTLSRLPPERSLTICTRLLYPLGRAQIALARRPWTRVIGAPIFLVSVPHHHVRQKMISEIYEYYGPRIISTHTSDEVRSWLEECSFEHLREVPVPTAWLAERPRRLAPDQPDPLASVT